MTTDLIAFFDESSKPLRDRASGKVLPGNRRFYVVGAVVLLSGDLDAVRAQLAEVKLKFGHQLHYGDQGRDKATELVQLLDGISEWDAYCYEAGPFDHSPHNEHSVRSNALGDALVDLNDLGVRNVVMETRSKPPHFTTLDERDEGVLKKLKSKNQIQPNFSMEHRGKDELLLSLPDIVAGARTDFLTAKHATPFAHITHRVTIK